MLCCFQLPLRVQHRLQRRARVWRWAYRHNVHPIAAAIGVRSYEIIDDSADIRKKLEETPGTVQLSAF